MPKTKFSKAEMHEISKELQYKSMLPCDHIGVYRDLINSTNYDWINNVIFVKGNDQFIMTFLTHTKANIGRLEDQLKQSFMKEVD